MACCCGTTRLSWWRRWRGSDDTQSALADPPWCRRVWARSWTSELVLSSPPSPLCGGSGTCPPSTGSAPGPSRSVCLSESAVTLQRNKKSYKQNVGLHQYSLILQITVTVHWIVDHKFIVWSVKSAIICFDKTFIQIFSPQTNVWSTVKSYFE